MLAWRLALKNCSLTTYIFYKSLSKGDDFPLALILITSFVNKKKKGINQYLRQYDICFGNGAKRISRNPNITGFREIIPHSRNNKF